MSHYTNPIGLYDFQAQLAARCILRPDNLAAVDTGLGKTHLALATAAILFEDAQIDHCLIVVEKNKIEEWEEDYARFTNLDVNVFYGPKRKLRDSQVTLTTYATMRDSMVTVHPADNRVYYPTEIMEWFVGKRLLVAFDEAALFGGSRTSKTYRAFEMALDKWRVQPTRTLGLTATPLERSPENFFNIIRLLAPHVLPPTIKAWEDRFVVAHNRWGHAWKFRDLEGFAAMISPVLIRKRKTDADVREQFPTTVEKFVGVTLDKAHMDAYKAFDGFIDDLPANKQLPAFRALNAFVCHPRSVFHSSWEEAHEWIDRYGADKLRKLKATKAERLIHDVQSILAADDKGGVLVFSQSVSALRCLAEDMHEAGIEFVEYHGGRSDKQNREAKEDFRAGKVQVMLASSKAERGINLPEAHYIRMFDVPTRHSEYVQRLNRGSRIGSNEGGTLSVKTYVTNGTIEQASKSLWLRRNEWSDTIMDADAVGDEGFTSAYERMQAIRAAAREEKERAA